MPPRKVAQEDLEPGKRYYIDSLVMKTHLDDVLGSIRCSKWVGTFMKNEIDIKMIKSYFSDVDCMGKQWRWNGNEFTEYRDSVIHIGKKEFVNLFFAEDHDFYFYEIPEETLVNRIIPTTGGIRHYSRKNKKKRQKKRRNTKSKKYRK